jgi:protein-S-isoprenylcysteine O-methyltransferase Ste14
MEKLSFLGIGPKIARGALPFLAISICVTIIFPAIFTFGEAVRIPLMYIGIALLAIGLVFYASTVRQLLKGLKETRLMTTGAFCLCQNPLYASIILMIIPGLALLMNSWIILFTGIIGAILFKRNIASEYAELEKFFGEDYRKYRAQTPEFFPFPLKKWFPGKAS